MQADEQPPPIARLQRRFDRLCVARPLGWDENLTAEDALDLEPYSGGTARITGPIRVVRSDTPPVGPLTVVLVGGKEADPDTVEAV